MPDIPFVSIIIPVYNTEKYLPRCLDSVLAQSYSNFELILVDDGSVDNSGKICDEYAARDSRIRVLHQDNQGVSIARNNGMAAAQGEYISFIDSDDWVEPDYLMSFINVSIPTDDAQLVGLVVVHKDIYGHTIINDGFSSLVFCVAKLYNKEIVQRNHIVFPPGQTIGEDSFFIASYLNHVSDYSVLSYRGYHYESNDQGTCIKNKKNVYVSSREVISNLKFLELGSNTPLAIEYMRRRTGMSFFDFINKMYDSSLSRKERVQFLKSVCGSTQSSLDFFPLRYQSDAFAKLLFFHSWYCLGDFVLTMMFRIREILAKRQ